MTDVAEPDDLRAELERAIADYLRRTEGFTPEVEIRAWKPIDAWLRSAGESYRGELFLSLRRFADPEAGHEELKAARDRLRVGFKDGLVDERLKHGDVEDVPPGIFNEDGGARITLGLLLRVHV